MIHVEVVKKDGAKRTVAVAGRRAVVGRAPEADVVLPVSNVSKQHCAIAVGDEGISVVDLGSTNGTYVNGRRIAQPVVIGPDDTIYVGEYALRVRVEPDAADRRSGAPSPPARSGAREEEPPAPGGASARLGSVPPQPPLPSDPDAVAALVGNLVDYACLQVPAVDRGALPVPATAETAALVRRALFGTIGELVSQGRIAQETAAVVFWRAFCRVLDVGTAGQLLIRSDWTRAVLHGERAVVWNARGQQETLPLSVPADRRLMEEIGAGVLEANDGICVLEGDIAVWAPPGGDGPTWWHRVADAPAVAPPWLASVVSGEARRVAVVGRGLPYRLHAIVAAARWTDRAVLLAPWGWSRWAHDAPMLRGDWTWGALPDDDTVVPIAADVTPDQWPRVAAYLAGGGAALCGVAASKDKLAGLLAVALGRPVSEGPSLVAALFDVVVAVDGAAAGGASVTAYAADGRAENGLGDPV